MPVPDPSLESRFGHIPEVRIGAGVEIHPGVEITGLRRLVIGDYSRIGPGVRVFGGGELVVGDYVKIHNDTTLCAKHRITLGHVAWVGQESYLDGTGDLRIGDFACLGIRSQCFTHARGGDALQGCVFEGDRVLDLGEDVWLMTGCLVSPCVIGAKTVAMMGSVVTRSAGPNRILGGNPAVDITDKFDTPPYVEPAPAEKAARFTAFLDDYFSNIAPAHSRDRVRVVERFPESPDPARTYYNLATREYTKTHHPEEVALNRWLFPCKAKFRPRTIPP